MRALLVKDLLILRRSRLLVALLVVYPIAIALLIGLAISRSPGKPKVAIVDQTPPGQTVAVGDRRVPVDAYAQQIFSQVQPVRASSRSQAVKKIEAGEVLAAVVIPADIAARLGTGLHQAQLEVIYNGNALEQSLVHAQIESALAQANIGFSEEIQRAASQAIGALLSGRNLGGPEVLAQTAGSVSRPARCETASANSSNPRCNLRFLEIHAVTPGAFRWFQPIADSKCANYANCVNAYAICITPL